MAKIIGIQIGKQVCEALGLDASKVRSIDIHVKANELVTAQVEHYIDGDEAQKLVNVLSAYTLRLDEDFGHRPVESGEDVTTFGDEHARMAKFFKGSE